LQLMSSLPLSSPYYSSNLPYRHLSNPMNLSLQPPTFLPVPPAQQPVVVSQLWLQQVLEVLSNQKARIDQLQQQLVLSILPSIMPSSNISPLQQGGVTGISSEQEETEEELNDTSSPIEIEWDDLNIPQQSLSPHLQSPALNVTSAHMDPFNSIPDLSPLSSKDLFNFSPQQSQQQQLQQQHQQQLQQHQQLQQQQLLLQSSALASQMSKSLKLTNHKRRKQGNYTCPYSHCENSFSSQFSLKRHIKRHTREKTHSKHIPTPLPGETKFGEVKPLQVQKDEAFQRSLPDDMIRGPTLQTSRSSLQDLLRHDLSLLPSVTSSS